MAVFLIPDHVKVTRPIGNKRLTINQKIIPDTLKATKRVASYVLAGQPMKPCAPLHGDGVPQGITVHNTNMISPAAGTNAAEQYVRATYNGNMGGVVVHYYVWHDVIWQALDDHERGWHAADGSSRTLSHDGKTMIGGNLDTIAIEAIGPDAETEETTAALCAYLCQEYNLLPSRDIYTHKYFSGKECPVYILPHWDAFLAQVAAIYLHDVGGDTAGETPVETSPDDTPDSWAESSWKWGHALGLVTSSKPREPITTQQLLVILDRYNQL